jgi:hypothetical protein
VPSFFTEPGALSPNGPPNTPVTSAGLSAGHYHPQPQRLVDSVTLLGREGFKGLGDHPCAALAGVCSIFVVLPLLYRSNVSLMFGRRDLR